MRIRLVSDWRQCYKWLSIHAMTLAASVQGVWVLLPDDLRASVPHDLTAALTVALLAAGVAGRLVDQGAAK